MSRNDLIRLIDQTRVDQNLQYHLSYRKMINFEKRKIFIMSQTEAELLNEKIKTMQRIKNDQFKMTKTVHITIDQSKILQSEII